MSVSLRLDDIIVNVRQLMLDPNNYRLAYDSKATVYPDGEVVEQQEVIERKLAKEKLSDLRDSIVKNGFLEVDRIVVRKLDGSEKEEFLVVEGNRRTAVLKSLLEDHENGIVKLDDVLLAKLNSINVVLINSTDPDEIKNYANTLMGIRHVSGPKKWTGMQSAKLICDLFDKNKSASQIGALLGISAIEANRRRRGYLAYSQLAEDRDYAKHVKNKHYTLMLEFVSKKNIRDWLGWEDDKKITKNRKFVYSHIAGENPEITNPTQAREFIKAISIPRFRTAIESGTKFSQLGPISESTEDIDAELKRFRIFLKDVSMDLFTPTNHGTLRTIQNKIGDILKGSE